MGASSASEVRFQEQLPASTAWGRIYRWMAISGSSIFFVILSRMLFHYNLAAMIIAALIGAGIGFLLDFLQNNRKWMS